jgi:O-antigen ligase
MVTAISRELRIPHMHKSDFFSRLFGIAFCITAATPFIVGIDWPPITGTLQQIVAYGVWGFALLIGGLAVATRSNPEIEWRLFLYCLAAIATYAAWSSVHFAQSLDTAIIAMAAILCGGGAFFLGRQLISDFRLQPALKLFFVGLVVAGLLNTGFCVIQVLSPAWVDNFWIAAGSLPGRANGNLRQPNHLAHLQLVAIIATNMLMNSEKLRLRAAIGLQFILSIGLALSGSRLLIAGGLLITLIAWLPWIVARRNFMSLRLLPLAVTAGWAFSAVITSLGGQTLFMTERVASITSSSSRMGLWKESLEMIAAHPWVGVGWGEFNFAWTLMPKGQQTYEFTHAHNLILHLTAEIGIPASLVFFSLLVLILRSAVRNAAEPTPEKSLLQATSLLLLAVMLLHSFVEYPLWYIKFFVLSLFLLGVCSVSSHCDTSRNIARRANAMTLCGALTLAGALFAAHDYRLVTPLGNISNRESEDKLNSALASGKKSVLYSWYAYRDTALGMESDPYRLGAIRYASHALFIDAKLLIAWADTLNALGDSDRARYLSQRIAEFRGPEVDFFFKTCGQVPSASTAYQCHPPSQTYSVADFR